MAGPKDQALKIYTKTGDTGETGLIGGVRVAKNSARIAAIGDVDELNASIGLSCILSQHGVWQRIQSLLFEIGAELASPGEERFQTVSGEDIEFLEASIDEMESGLPPLKNFILPGGSESAARLHFARSVCRRAERTVLTLHHVEPVREELRVFLNRLADWLFVAARTANALSNVEDVNWKRGS